MLFHDVYIWEFWLCFILSFINFQLQQLGEFIVMIIHELRHGVHHFFNKVNITKTQTQNFSIIIPNNQPNKDLDDWIWVFGLGDYS